MTALFSLTVFSSDPLVTFIPSAVQVRSKLFEDMATLTVSELEASLEKLNLNVPIPHFASADVLNKPLDLVRSYLADILSSLAEADRTAAYNSISLSNDPLHGDLTVVLPRLCPGAKAGELAKDLIKKVRIKLLSGGFWLLYSI